MLEEALAHRRFELFYQLIFDATSRRLTGVEALVRWTHPQLGNVPAGDFILVAEQTGILCEIGAWVFDQACAQWRSWIGDGFGPIDVSVNVSAKEMREPGFVERLDASVKRHEVDPRFFTLELKEVALHQVGTWLVPTLHRLEELGVALSVDNFGTGCSSLSALQRHPIEEIKIDSSFIHGLPDNAQNASLVSAIVAMAHKLRLRVVAVGVEKESQLRYLRAVGCEQVQGFLLSEPLSADQVTDHLVRRPGEGPRGVVPFQRRDAATA